MATMHWPYSAGPRKNFLPASIPFIMLADGSYASPVNYYLQEKSTQRAIEDIRGAKIIEAVSRMTVRAEAYSILNFINFVEVVGCIPESHCEDIWSVKNWHHNIWKELMASGHWTREFFSSGVPEPINLRRTIRTRVRCIRNAWQWMRNEGLIADYHEEIPALLFSTKVHALRANLERQAAARFGACRPKSNYQKRRNPRDYRGLSGQEIKALLVSTNTLTEKLIILLALFVGLRREEIETNSLCAGHWFERPAEQAKIDVPAFPRGRYLLSYGDHDDMIGVMPSVEMAFLPDEEARENCSYRVIGKGTKIRRVRVPFKLMRLIWLCYFGERRRILDRNSIPASREPASFFLDRYGHAYSSNEPHRVCRRPFRLSYAAMAGSSSTA